MTPAAQERRLAELDERAWRGTITAAECAEQAMLQGRLLARHRTHRHRVVRQIAATRAKLHRLEQRRRELFA